jgi:hypothetical protein
MSYFIKAIPVEGEINAGDKCIDLQSQEIFKMGTAFRNLPDNLKAKLREGAQKVKLFLCSRDIQVGDSIIDDQGTQGVVEEKLMTGLYRCRFGKEFYSELAHVYKVIGEISPDALSYVKEGDEIGEKNVRFHAYKRANGRLDPYQSITEPTYKGLLSHYYYKPSMEIICEIKGKCGHFH